MVNDSHSTFYVRQLYPRNQRETLIRTSGITTEIQGPIVTSNDHPETSVIATVTDFECNFWVYVAMVTRQDTARASQKLLNTLTGIYVDLFTGTLYTVKWKPSGAIGTVMVGVCSTQGFNEVFLFKLKGLTFDKYGNMYVAGQLSSP
ncbi:unnamed protein product [Adineta ricciae]|uniref:Uncharacterized protein n=1 Tax=Adineta ricciae TaxID=249248 RepID=A0A814YDH1_ADIRI|nr:unnamed protein product [Adineta ricciae]CAF1608948.1 unnamed protein product [Adineta ricciae]